ncbi:class I SAM-dependent methyltransferase [Tropicibacter naphthalenivorans]|uniref:Class I SAM-dependent methyltransferase n=1 Tax=Tropicibacter naphthalenivorans TaxID=441103 RepID=A0A0N7M115_9RHOB|nr:class I SAM-dependent methyltransferase [Tropicibacter naphthalenivorans]CUH82001.1 hypothetical protein TRN7648_03764 [Tropicibacter naphthalenivorans]SMD07730.1 hypothetical protein SAMN04488093_11612 [Tropicibacter naphthalenivorans]
MLIQSLKDTILAARQEILDFKKSALGGRNFNWEEAGQLSLIDGTPTAITAQAKLRDARIFSGRLRLAEFSKIWVGRHPKCAEVGVGNGNNAVGLNNLLGAREFCLIDDDLSRISAANQEQLSKPPFVHLTQGRKKALDSLLDDSTDYLYVNAFRGYASALAELNAAIPKLRPGAVLQIHGYSNWAPTAMAPSGVMAATNELINTLDCAVVGLSLDPVGHHDIALMVR